MANYRTIVPGMSNDNPEQSQTIYQPSMGGSSAANRTIIPGMAESNPVQQQPQPAARPVAQQNQTQSEKPLVGFLASVSRRDAGEYWVLRQGQNSIGSSVDCDIQLSEASVSGLHAVLAIHRNPQNNNLLSIGIMDKGSSNGVFVNEEYIGFNPFQCKSMDKIKIGNYQLLLMIFDAKEQGLGVEANFASNGDNDTNVQPSQSSDDNGDYTSMSSYADIGAAGTIY